MTKNRPDVPWTPEARAIREAERKAARRAYNFGLHAGVRVPTVDQYVDEKYPAPPPEYTYGRAIESDPHTPPVRRRSDGRWEYQGNGDVWYPAPSFTDARARALAAEVPLTDAECEALLNVRPDSLYSSLTHTRDNMRVAVQRVLRGEVES